MNHIQIRRYANKFCHSVAAVATAIASYAAREPVTIATTVAAIATALSAIFLWRQTSDFRDQERRQLRSYIVADFGYLDNCPEPSVWDGLPLLSHPCLEQSMPLQATFKIKNQGHTPAYRTVIDVASFQISKADLAPQFKECPEVWADSNKVPMYFGKQIPWVTPQKNLTADERSDLISGDKRAFIHGIVCYEDIFSLPHWTKFCVFWRRESNGRL